MTQENKYRNQSTNMCSLSVAKCTFMVLDMNWGTTKCKEEENKPKQEEQENTNNCDT